MNLVPVSTLRPRAPCPLGWLILEGGDSAQSPLEDNRVGKLVSYARSIKNQRKQTQRHKSGRKRRYRRVGIADPVSTSFIKAAWLLTSVLRKIRFI